MEPRQRIKREKSSALERIANSSIGRYNNEAKPFQNQMHPKNVLRLVFQPYPNSHLIILKH